MTRVELFFSEFPSYLTHFMVIDHGKESIKVEVHSDIHVRKVATMPQSFSIEYVSDCPQRFRGYVLDFTIRAFGLKKEPVKYS